MTPGSLFIKVNLVLLSPWVLVEVTQCCIQGFLMYIYLGMFFIFLFFRWHFGDRALKACSVHSLMLTSGFWLLEALLSGVCTISVIDFYFSHTQNGLFSPTDGHLCYLVYGCYVLPYNHYLILNPNGFSLQQTQMNCCPFEYFWCSTNGTQRVKFPAIVGK